MEQILIGSLFLSLLHAVIPSHWLPIIAIGKRKGWSLSEVSQVTFLAALSHVLSTVLLGGLLGFIGAEISDKFEKITHLITPLILIIAGIIFIYRHQKHHHFHLRDDSQAKRSKRYIIAALTTAMFFSPCLEIEAFFLLAGVEAEWLVWVVAFSYLLITTTGMVLFVRFVYKGILKLNWHSLEHNAGVITGITLVLTGVLTFFIH